jgi:hypothetical protein
VRKLSGVASIVFDVDGAELNREKKIANVLSCSCRDARAESDSSIKEMALRRKFPCVAFALLWVRHTTPPLITPHPQHDHEHDAEDSDKGDPVGLHRLTGQAKIAHAAAAQRTVKPIIGKSRSDLAIASTGPGSNAKTMTIALSCSACFSVALFTLHRPVSSSTGDCSVLGMQPTGCR